MRAGCAEHKEYKVGCFECLYVDSMRLRTALEQINDALAKLPHLSLIGEIARKALKGE